MASFYPLAFKAWRLFATEEVVGRSTLLANDNVPLLLSNAAWFPEVDDFQTIATWYVERDTVPALTVPAVRDEAFDEALRGSAFTLERAFTFQTLNEPLEYINLFTEQVSWAQGRVLGEHLASHFGYGAYGVALGAAITKAMQQCPEIISFAAYDADEVVGALVAFEQEGSLSAMMMSGELEFRLYQEALNRGVQASVLEPLPEGITVRDKYSFERWSIR